MVSEALSSVPTTASCFVLLQVENDCGSNSEPGKGEDLNIVNTLGRKSTTNEKTREKKEQQESEAYEPTNRASKKILQQFSHAVCNA